MTKRPNIPRNNNTLPCPPRRGFVIEGFETEGFMHKYTYFSTRDTGLGLPRAGPGQASR